MGRWDTSTRRSRLPGNWESIRAAAFKRDGNRCTWIYWVEGGKRERCTAVATDADHRIPGDDHSLDNIQSLCSPHHDQKTHREGRAAFYKKKREIHARFRRTPEEHPGYTEARRRV